MTIWQIYYWASAIVTFWSCIKLGPRPPSVSGLDNLVGSFLVAFILGWLVWPFALVAAMKTPKPHDA